MPGATETLHASCAAWRARGILITGASGSGKSSFTLRLMSLGCQLVSDDRTIVEASAQGLRATCPPAIAGQIEARGVGILQVPHRASADVVCIVDLDQHETERMPPQKWMSILGCDLRLFHKTAMDTFPDAILQYVMHTASDLS